MSENMYEAAAITVESWGMFLDDGGVQLPASVVHTNTNPIGKD